MNDLVAIHGTTKEGERVVVIHEEVFLSMLEAVEKVEGKQLTLEWGTPKFGSITFFEPTVYEEFEPGDADPLTVGQND